MATTLPSSHKMEGTKKINFSGKATPNFLLARRIKKGIMKVDACLFLLFSVRND